MARKKTRFQWTEEDGELEQGERRDQVEARQLRHELAALSGRLADLTPGQLKRLALDELLVKEIVLLGRLGPQSARRRQVLRVSGLLRGADLEDLEIRLAGSGQDEGKLRSLEHWRSKLIGGGDTELEAFIEAHPSADRQRLRSLIRQARTPGRAGSSAARRLFQEMKAEEPGGGEE